MFDVGISVVCRNQCLMWESVLYVGINVVCRNKCWMLDV